MANIEPGLIIVLCILVFLNHTKQHTDLPKISQQTREINKVERNKLVRDALISGLI